MTARKFLTPISLLFSVIFLFVVGCKTEAENADVVAAPGSNAAIENGSNDNANKCSPNSAISNVSACPSGKIQSPSVWGLSEVPLLPNLSPILSWGYSVSPGDTEKIETQIRVVKASNKIEVSPWATVAATRISNNKNTVSGLSLIESEEYYFELRASAKGKYSDIVKSAFWKARVGKGTWGNISGVNAPSSRSAFTALWTGSKLIIWGGQTENGLVNTGAIYNPTTDSWTTMSTVNAPNGRALATAVWTGTEMIVWGGTWNSTGGRYNPTTNTWASMSNVGEPVGNTSHTSVWTGSKMIVWGGEIPTYGHAWSNEGAIYDPTSNSWSPVSTVDAPSARSQHIGIWTGTEMLIWGGGAGSSYTEQPTGALYNPTTNTWRSISSYSPRSFAGFTQLAGYHWTGSKLIMRYATYDPATNIWEEIPLSSDPRDAEESLYLIAVGNVFPVTAWTGSQFFTFGGERYGSTSTGGLYNPDTKEWTGTDLKHAPTGNQTGTAQWIGNKVLIWNGTSGYTYTP